MSVAITRRRMVDADVVITVLGGVVNGIFSDNQDLRIVVVDWDDVSESDEKCPAQALYDHQALKTIPIELTEILRG